MNKYLSNTFEPSKIVDFLDEINLWSAPFGIKLLDYIDYKQNILALDIGFGTGFPLTELAMRLGNSSVVYGIDPWKDAIERVNKKINYYGITNIRIIEGLAESIPLENNSVDLITSNNGINNTNDINKVLSECSRVIKTGGQFVFTMNTDKSLFEFYLHMENVLTDLHMNNEIDLMHQHITQKRPPIDNIISLLQKHGFIIKDLEHDKFNYKFSNGTAMLNHFFIRFAFIDSWIKFLPADKSEHIFDMVESRLNEQALKCGGIKLCVPFSMFNCIKNN